MPPAASTSSGPQFPIAMGGAIHSRQTTLGWGRSRVFARSAASRSRHRPATSASPSRGAIDRAGDLEEAGEDTVDRSSLDGEDVLSEQAPGELPAVGQGSAGLAAQTSQWLWVRTTSGASFGEEGLIDPVEGRSPARSLAQTRSSIARGWSR